MSFIDKVKQGINYLTHMFDDVSDKTVQTNKEVVSFHNQMDKLEDVINRPKVIRSRVKKGCGKGQVRINVVTNKLK